MAIMQLEKFNFVEKPAIDQKVESVFNFSIDQQILIDLQT